MEPLPNQTSRIRRFVDGVEARKGDVTLTLSALVYLASWLLMREYLIAGQLLRATGEAALVGGLCDYIALKMIFEQRWYLPNSGVLPRNRRKLIDGIANTIENQWLTPQMIGDKLRELDLVKRLGRYLEDVSLHDMLGRPQLSRLCAGVADYADSPPVRRFIEDRLRASATTPIKVARALRLVNFEELSARVGSRLRQVIATLPDNLELLGEVEGRLHRIGDELQQRDSAARATAYHLIDTLLEHAVNSSRGQIALTVKENLSRLSDEEIRFQIESRTRTHLEWIRVNGGIFGALFGACFGLLNFAVANWPSLVAMLR